MKKRFESISKWDLKKYDWKKCKAETDCWKIIEWEVCVEDDWVYILHNNPQADWDKPNNKKWYSYTWSIYTSEDDCIFNNYTYKWIEIETLAHNEVEVDWVVYRYVYVSDDSEEEALESKYKKILLSTLSWKVYSKYICVDDSYTEDFLNWGYYDYLAWDYTVDIEIPETKEEKKERKLILTDKEWEDAKNILNINY